MCAWWLRPIATLSSLSSRADFGAICTIASLSFLSSFRRCANAARICPALVEHFVPAGERAERLEARCLCRSRQSRRSRNMHGRATFVSCATSLSGCCCWPAMKSPQTMCAWRCRRGSKRVERQEILAQSAPSGRSRIVFWLSSALRCSLSSQRHGRHVTQTAKSLGLERSHLYKKCQQLGIDMQNLPKD